MKIIIALFFRELRKFTRDHTRLFIITITPFAFIYVLASIFTTQLETYSLDYVIAGVAIATVFNTSLNSASSIIGDISSGFLKEILVSPISRIQVVIGQMLAGAVIATIQGFLIFLVGMFSYLGFEKWHTIILVFLSMLLVSLVYSALGILIATTLKNYQTYSVVEQAIVIPLIFLSGAYVPTNLLPRFLQYISYLNPMTYTTMFFRGIVLETSLSMNQMVEMGVALDFNGWIITPIWSGVIVALFGGIFFVWATHSFQKADFMSEKKAHKK